MKLLAARVQNFRSIVDSGVVEIEDRVTVLVGRNEQGKTNFLKALYSFNPTVTYYANDFPNHLRTNLEDKKESEIPIVTLWLEPSDTERQEIGKVVSNIRNVVKFKVTRFFDGTYEYTSVLDDSKEAKMEFSVPDLSEIVALMKKEAETLKQKLDSQVARLPQFASVRPQYENHVKQFTSSIFTDAATIDNLIKTFLTALKGLPNQDATIQSDISMAAKALEEQKAKAQSLLQTDTSLQFLRMIPHFVLHSALLDNIPKEVNIASFTKDPDGTSKGMANLCKVAGLSMQKIQQLASTAETETREAHEDHYKASLSGAINEFWHQVIYEVHFRFDTDRLSVSISDSNYDRRIAPTERSDGFQWYLSFYTAILSEVSETEPMVLLLDNPGLEIHPDGQRDIKRFLQEKMVETTQVIYVTHSPAMIDTFNLAQVRRVEHLGNDQGTKVTSLPVAAAGVDLLEPVRSAIGANLVDTLMANSRNVLVEGAADRPILEGALKWIRPMEFNRFAINGSISETKMLLPTFYEKTGLPFVVLLDADSGGREIKSKLIHEGIPEARILLLDRIDARGTDFELEDLISEELYLKAVREAYPKLEIESPEETDGKRTKRYEKLFRTKGYQGFSKRQVGEAFRRLVDGGDGDEETKQQLTKIVDDIHRALEDQLHHENQ